MSKKRVVWITGASMGLGAALAKEMSNKGDVVYVSARSKDKLLELASQVNGPGRCEVLVLDVTDREATQRAIDTIIATEGRIDVAVLNAGTFYPVRGFELNFEAFDKSMDINFNGVINGLVPLVHEMNHAGGGQIAVVSSVAGYGGLPKSSAYGASKAALINMMECLKFDLAGMNIKVQVINPGFIDTPLTEKNKFPMPFLMPVEKAAKRLADGLNANGFEITFPRRFTWQLKLINLLPYQLYFSLISAVTGKKPAKQP